MFLVTNKQVETFVRKLLEEERGAFGDVVEAAIQHMLKDRLPDYVHELDPKKSYILVLPESLPSDDVQTLLKSLRDVDVNLFVVQSDSVKIVEFN